MKLVYQLNEKDISSKFDLQKMESMLSKVVRDLLMGTAELESEDRAIIE
jgi:hypothetical protein